MTSDQVDDVVAKEEGNDEQVTKKMMKKKKENKDIQKYLKSLNNRVGDIEITLKGIKKYLKKLSKVCHLFINAYLC